MLSLLPFSVPDARIPPCCAHPFMMDYLPSMMYSKHPYTTTYYRNPVIPFFATRPKSTKRQNTRPTNAPNLTARKTFMSTANEEATAFPHPATVPSL